MRSQTCPLVLAAVLLAAAGCLRLEAAGTAAPTQKVAAAAPAKKLAQVRGFCIQLTDPNGLDSYLKAVDDIADMGCTWINFVIAARQETVHSETISIVWQNIPSEKDIEKILNHAKERGIRTMLMPIVLLNQSGEKEWRGVISPDNWDNWFASYTAYITFMAKLANQCHVDLFCVGSELLSTETFTDRWTACINEIKKVYHGKLTYSSNWDHYETPTFWDQVDYIGMNNYNELAESPGASINQLNEAWGPIKKKYLDFVAREKKPFLFTEVGWHNLQNTLAEPWNYVAEGEINLNEQLHAYESFVDTWGDVPDSQFMGAFIWEWKPGSKPTDHGTYSLQDTPSLEVVKKWMRGT
ncbi:MAG TPA: hypothetical protein VH253_18680 [Phycisphaerae bacterium]|nr:hypothetical protein [Phycisphaerae bacterium]